MYEIKISYPNDLDTIININNILHNYNITYYVITNIIKFIIDDLNILKDIIRDIINCSLDVTLKLIEKTNTFTNNESNEYDYLFDTSDSDENDEVPLNRRVELTMSSSMNNIDEESMVVPSINFYDPHKNGKISHKNKRAKK